MTELAADKGWEIWQVGVRTPAEVERRSHIAPDLEA